MKIVGILLICLFARHEVASFTLNCEFRLNSEECKVTSLKVLETDIAVTAVAGTHASRKTNNDVKELWLTRDCVTQRAPTNICEFFQNMERMDIYGSSITKISRGTFKNCRKVVKACVLFTSLTTLPEDLFEDLIELKELFLYENKLVALPPNLIAKNTKLTTLSAKSNQLSMIDIELGTSLTSIDLRLNACIDKRFPEDITTLALFVQEVVTNCESYVKKSFTVKTNELKKTLNQKESEIANLKIEKENLANEKSAVTSNLTDFATQLQKYKVINADLEKEIEAIRENSTQEVRQVFEENISLRLNVTGCLNEMMSKAELLKSQAGKNLELEGRLNKSSQEILSLQGNLTETVAAVGKLQLMTELLDADKINLNESLEECWTNLSTSSTVNGGLSSQLSELNTKLDNCTNVIHDDIDENSENEKIHFVYFISLALAFAVIYVATVVYMRRKAGRVLIKEMVNQQVSMRHLLEK